MQQKQEQQLTNIDLHAVNQGIDLLNKYYPGLGQVTFQPVQQLLPTNPLIARQWANVPQDFSQDQSFENDKFQDLNVQVESQVNSQDQDPGRYVKSCYSDDHGAKRIGQMEGGGLGDFRARAYYDQTGKYITEYKEGATIGWGHLIESRAEFEKYKNGITEQEAIRLKQQDLKKAEIIVKRHIKAPITQDVCNALVSRAYNGGEGAFTFRDNGSKFVADYINSGRKLNFDNPDKDTKLFIAAYQRLDTTQHHYTKGVEYRRERELDMMKHDYTEHSTKEYQSRQLYGPGKKNTRWTRVFK